MRTSLLAGAAFCAVFVALPALAPEIDAGRDIRPGGPLDPRTVAGATCAPDVTRSLRARFLAAAGLYAQAATSGAAAEGAPALIPGVASQAIEPTTANDEARAYFAQGLGLADGFNHAESARAFRAAQALDPDCAICFWGEALVLGPNINAGMMPGDDTRALAAARTALEKAGSASEVERALIEAVQARYSDAPDADRAALDMAYSQAMQAVAERFPEHDQVQALTAEAIMDTQPWDYWEPGGRVPKGAAGQALERVERVLARNPDNVLAIHLHIHLTEASDDPWRSAGHAERLGALAPAAGHLVHMPGHVWYRIGRFEDALETNLAAIEVDEAFFADAGDAASVVYRYGYYPHNLHFALTSAQMAGDGPTAVDLAERLDAALPMEMADLAGWIQFVKAAPWFARVQFGDAEALEAVLAAPKPERLALIEAAWRYARGEALARLGRAEEARAEAEALATLGAATDWPTAAPATPGGEVVEIMRHIVLGRAAMAEQDYAGAVEELIVARDLQAALPYTEPPFWWYPARQTLAAALLMDGQAERAEQEFFAMLVESPDNGWGYWGLAEARAAQGDAEGAEAARTLWRQVWLGAEEPTLERL